MIIVIARKELRSLFATPLGWWVLAIVQAVTGTYYALSFNQYFEMMQSAQWQVQRIGLTQFMAEGVFGVAAILMLCVVPLVTMKLVSDERKQQTLVLLMSAPLEMRDIILGKLVGIMAYLSLLILSMTLMIALLMPWAEIDVPYLLTHALGLWLLVLASAALGLYCSCLTVQPVLAAFCSLTTLTLCLLLDKFFAEDQQAAFHHLSLMQHYRQFALGMLNSFDVLFFGLFTAFFVLLSIRQLQAQRRYG